MEFRIAVLYKRLASTRKPEYPRKPRVKKSSNFSAKFRAANFNFFNNVKHHRAGHTTEPDTFSWHREHHLQSNMSQPREDILTQREGRITLAI